MKKELNKGVTLIALIITIIVLLILAGITLAMVVGDNGIFNKANTARDENNKKAATETMNFKITNVQITKYAEEKRMPTLKELADNFCDDDDFDKVEEKTIVGSLTKISSENPTAIIAKLKQYPYEFEINSSLQLASIDGAKVANIQGGENGSANYIMLTSTVSSVSGGSFTINVNDTEAHNSRTLYYFVNDKLVYTGTDTSRVITEVNGEAVKDNTEYEIKVLSNPYTLKITTNQGDNVNTWLSCIGNPNSQGYSLNNLNDLFNNTELMNDLFNSNVAKEYFKKSKNHILPAAIANEKACNYLDRLDTYRYIPTLSNNTNTLESSNYGSGYTACMAFDNNINTYWVSAGGDTQGYLGYNFNEDVIVYKVSITGWAEISGEAFDEFYIQYYDGNEWKNASSKLKLNMDENYTTVRTFYNINSTMAKAQKWRVKAVSAKGGRYIGCRELRFYGIKVP